MATLNDVRRDWDGLGQLDPFWAVAGPPSSSSGSWDVAELFDTGRAEIARVMTVADRLGLPRERRSAFDFGCGVGRLTRALSDYFESCCGVDIAESMVTLAKQLNADRPACQFVVNTAPDLSRFADGSFDMVYSHATLQTITDRATIYRYIAEMYRLLSQDGLLVFHLPSHIALLYRLHLRRRLFYALRRLGVSEERLYRRFKLFPNFNNAIPEREMYRYLVGLGGKVLEVEHHKLHAGRTYYVARASAQAGGPAR